MICYTDFLFLTLHDAFDIADPIYEYAGRIYACHTYMN